jgi:hypothetical protein
MIELLWENNLLTLMDVEYQIESVDIQSDIIVNIALFNEVYNCTYTVLANTTIINGVLQTSAQMIYDTLTSNV